jgi:hypothetical protein
VQPGTGRIFINDVGQSAWEEINDGIAGANYGWPSTEGEFRHPQLPTSLLHSGAAQQRHHREFLQGPSVPGRMRGILLRGQLQRVLSPLRSCGHGRRLPDRTVRPIEKVGADGALCLVGRWCRPRDRIFAEPGSGGHSIPRSGGTRSAGAFLVTLRRPPLVYQWQRSRWTSRARRRPPPLRTHRPPTTAPVRCRVTNGSGSDTSAERYLRSRRPRRPARGGFHREPRPVGPGHGGDGPAEWTGRRARVDRGRHILLDWST